AIQPKGIILSGSPHSVHNEERFTCDEAIFDLDIPILGICYGMDVMTLHYGGDVVKHAERSYSKAVMNVAQTTQLFEDSPKEQDVWMSFGDRVQVVPPSFTVDATDKEDLIIAMSNKSEKRYGIQFYPQVNETTYGEKHLEQFLFDICHCKGNWSMAFFIEDEVEKIR